jgi:nucleotide-binding universal stress UspA family protein
MTRSTGPEPRIVVGVDGSRASKAALTWAIRQGARTGAVVEVVTAYYWFPMPIEEIDFKTLATRVAEDAIFEAPDPDTPVKIVPKVVHGSPGKALVREAIGADLLVVGNRGHGAVSEALLGSVSHFCVHHAECPVVVTRDPANTAH